MKPANDRSAGRRLRSLGLCALTVAALLGLGVPQALGQACCAGASTLSPARLTSIEDAAVGLQLSAAVNTGSFDPAGHYSNNPSGASEQDFMESAFGTVKFADRAQVTLLVPFDETHRSIVGANEAGGGVGDVNLSVRYDFLLAKEVRYWPGVAVLAGGTAPTGRTVENSGDLLGTNATGLGAWQGTLGLALEQSYGPILVNLTGLLTDRTSRDVFGVHETLGLQFTGLAAVGYAFHFNAGLAFIVQTSIEQDPVLDGVTQQGAGRQSTAIGLAGGGPLWEDWRFQGSLTDALQISNLGQGQPVGITATLALLHSWSW